MPRFRRIDPWTELTWTARAALRGHASVAAAGEVARSCGYPMGEGVFKPHAQTMNALRLLALAWRDVPAEARRAADNAIAGVLDALDAWPHHLRVPMDELAAQRRERVVVRKRAPSLPAAPPYWIND